MPTYQYACTECGHAFEQVQSFSDDALTVCPECQGRLRKVFNAVGVVFKGSGFYRTDSRSGSSATDGAATSSTETKTETKSETKTESKPAPAAASSTSSD
ncbi:FmdB family transcriptional regulator [Nocardioides sp. Root1257]|uniref:FmdB family zinc ribbon protein n=1 Tax=unclassified Nocardioides TaxID=2615069 RepID=UPI0006F6A98F|nr:MULTISPECIES: FmdB family zinc ribbon protein [unclassified Nocardioides]KQW42601.1 FmdB family transcriptional regulator [Nocardioides sp. Root1257]KRC39859.1 FmdB family transcriptional regulator [Nocardioides sp. Root224]